jgi:hypothetical protein
MLGNAAELIFDFSPQYPDTMLVDQKSNVGDGQTYCLRGGSSVDDQHTCQFSTRVLMSGNSSSSYAGFRLLKVIE